MRTPRLLVVVYLVVGIVVASRRDYLGGIDTVRELLSALLAIALWPLVLLGVNLHLR